MSVFEGKFPQWVYLIAYNAIFALLWSFIFTQTAVTAITAGLDEVYPAVRLPVLFTQTAAFLEVLHAIIGKAPPRLLGARMVWWLTHARPRARTRPHDLRAGRRPLYRPMDRP